MTTKATFILIETKMVILDFYLTYNPRYDQTLCGYMKRHNQMDPIVHRGRGATKYELGLWKQVEYYQSKLKNPEYFSNELVRNGFNTCVGKEFGQQATPKLSPSSSQSSPTPSPPPSLTLLLPPLTLQSSSTSPPVPPENQSEPC